MTQREDTLATSPAADELQDHSPLAAIEDDVRSLMIQLSEARSALRQGEGQYLDSTRKLFLDLLEVLDGFGRVFRNIQAKEEQITPQMKVWLGNFRTVRRLLDKALSEQGVVGIETLDQEFDPHWHRVFEVVSDPSKRDGTIVEEAKAGYMWRGQVLRKAEVKVVGSTQPIEQDSTGEDSHG